MFKKLFKLSALTMCMMLGLAACSGGEETISPDSEVNKTENTASSEEVSVPRQESEETTNSDVANSNPKVKFEMEDGTVYVAELYPQYAPKTVENFIKLVNEGFYNGLTYHRVIPGFMVQGGCPQGTGMGGSGKNIPGEFASNGYKENTLSHKKGVISMARAQAPNSASSQFFICVADSTYLDGEYAAFGEIIEGMENVDAIATVRTDYNDKPMTPVVMKNVSVVTE